LTRPSVQISPADVGARVSVRTRLRPPRPSGHTMTDTLGYLRSWRDGILEVERRDGTLARLAEQDLIAGKRIPPAPERRPRTRELP
jgi:hypothetical protein